MDDLKKHVESKTQGIDPIEQARKEMEATFEDKPATPITGASNAAAAPAAVAPEATVETQALEAPVAPAAPTEPAPAAPESAVAEADVSAHAPKEAGGRAA
jgi:hypothetical protein